MKNLKLLLTAILLALSTSVNASLIGDMVTMQHYFPTDTTPHGALISTVVTADSTDTMCAYSGCGTYSADVGANTITLNKNSSSWATNVDFNGVFFDSLDDSYGNALVDVTVETNITDWDISQLSFDSNSIWINFLKLNRNIGIGYINLTLDYGTSTTPSAVPVPAAAWLFGSALLGFFGFSRRKVNA